LYNWAGATNGENLSIEDQGDTDYGANHVRVRGICPDGWHLPSDKEWSDLEEVIAKDAGGIYSTDGVTAWDEAWRTADGSNRGSHGKKMKSTTDVNITDSYNPNGTSKSAATGGFDALLTGHVVNGDRIYFGERASFWSSSSHDDTISWFRYLINSDDGVSRFNIGRWNRLSVRCKKDN
jgi:uncharacterized protein (TIGR02145 family)